MIKLENFTSSEIRKMVSKFNNKVKLTGYSKMKKQELINFIRNHKNLKVVENSNGVTISVKEGSITSEKTAPKPTPKPNPKPAPAPKEKRISAQDQFNEETKNLTPAQLFSYNQSRQGITRNADVSSKELKEAREFGKRQKVTMIKELEDFFGRDKGIYSKSKLIKNKKDLQDYQLKLKGNSPNSKFIKLISDKLNPKPKSKAK